MLHQDSEGHSYVQRGKYVQYAGAAGVLPDWQAAWQGLGGLEDVDEEYGWKGHGAFCEVDIKPLHGYDPKGEVPELPDGETDRGNVGGDCWVESGCGLEEVGRRSVMKSAFELRSPTTVSLNSHVHT